MGYRAIKTSESETNFYRRCLNSEPNPAAPGSRPQKEFCPTGFPVLGDKSTSFEVVPSLFVTGGYYLTLSWPVFVTR